MSKFVTVQAVVAVTLLGWLVSGVLQAQSKPPRVIATSDILYPPASVGSGIVVFDVSIDDMGSLTGSSLIRDVPSLTGMASDAIRSWRFAPALDRGIPAPSELRIAVVFRPPAYFVSEPTLASVPPVETVNPDGTSILAPGILSAAYPVFPIDARQAGTVVLQVGVHQNGEIAGLKVIRSADPFTRPALAAVRRWRFEGTGRSTSSLAIAFAFTPPVNNR